MAASKSITRIAALLAFCLALTVPASVSAAEVDSSIAACLKAWGDHPFGKTPQFKTLGTSVKVFGIGSNTADTAATDAPALVLVEPEFNLMGASTVDLLNPNGWYCLRTTVSILGTVKIRAHCKAQLASTSSGSTVLGNEGANRSLKDLTVTVIGSVAVERPCN